MLVKQWQGAFYSLIKMFNQDQKWNIEEQDHLLWLFYGPALKVRERLVDYQRLNRTISALSCLSMAFEADQKKVMKAFEPLYDYPLFQKIKTSAS